MTINPSRRIAALSVALALPLALLSATPASAATVGVTTWANLKSAFLVNGDTVRLDANITADSLDRLAVEAGESIILDLNGHTLTITNPGVSNPAILVPPTSSLTINATDSGTLTALGGIYGAGIGGGLGSSSGIIIINGGAINASSTNYGAGIGGGQFGNGGTTTINGGTIITTGGGAAAGIGGGVGGSGGTTTINGGTITATGSSGAAGIGGGAGSSGGGTTINGGTTTAIGGDYGAGIGGGQSGNGGTTTINGGTTTTTGGLYAAGIGGGESGTGNTTIINAGTVTATGGGSAAGIGGGRGGSAGVLEVNGSPTVSAATDGSNPTDAATLASTITNPTTPAGVGYSATASTVGTGGKLELRFNYLITFAASGGNAIAPQTINDGDTLTAPATPTRAGFTFAGWTSGGSAYDFTTPLTAPLTLTATWIAALAATGVADVTAPLGIATLLLAGGAILIALRRRAATRSA